MHICPKCGLSDQVEKVSTIYLQGFNAGKTPSAQSEGGDFPKLSKAELSKLHRLLAPPSSERSQVIRPIHPDLMLLVFSGLFPIFLVGIASSQRTLLLPAILVLVFFYLLYFWQRKRLIARYDQLKQSQVEEKRRVEQAIGRWMKTYYCARDELVFKDGAIEGIPVARAEELMWGKWP
jgi:hypothetical protein